MANENIIAKTVEKKAATKSGKNINDLIKSMQPEIKKALPEVMTPERFTRMVLTAIRTTPQLGACEPMSFLAAMMQAAQLGLEPNTPLGQAYLLPYKNNARGETTVQFQIGYKGLIDLAYRSGEIESIQAHCVYDNDTFEFEYGLEPKLKHIPAKADRGNIFAVYAIFRTKQGGYGFEVMSIDDINKHAAKYSKSFGSNYSPWKTSFEEMAKKTVVKKVLKYAPLQSNIARTISADETIKTEISDDMFEVAPNIIEVEADESEAE